MSTRDELVERNVAKLLARAYRQVEPSAEFEDALRATVDRTLAGDVARAEPGNTFRDAAPRDDEPVLVERSAARTIVADPTPPRTILRRVAFAVAASLLAAFGLWWLGLSGGGVGRESLDTILARGAVALRETGEGWYAVEPQDGVAHHALVAPLEVRTPASARLELAAAGGESLGVEAASAVVVIAAPLSDAPGEPPHGLDARLDGGALVAVRSVDVASGAAAAAWRIALERDASGSEVVFELERGSLMLVARTGAECARAALSSDGAARLVTAAGSEPWSSVAAPDAASSASAPLEPLRSVCAANVVAPDDVGAQRTSVATGEPPANEAPEEDVVAPPTADVFGTVVDAATGEPLDDFTVVLAPVLTLPRPRDPKAVPFTDAKGRFAIPEVLAGQYVVWVGATGHAYFASATVELGETPFELRAELEVGERVTGRVFDRATGLAVEGARVISESDVPAAMIELVVDPSRESWIQVARTDPSGRFALQHLRSTKARLRVTAPGYAPAWMPCDGTSAVEIGLSPPARLVGRVEASDGSPCAEHVLVVVPLDGSQYPLYWSLPLFTDAEGNFETSALPPIQCVVVHLGAYSERKHWSSAPAVRYVTLVENEERRADFVTKLRGARLFGRVLDPEGRPVPHRTLTLVPAGSAVEDPTRWRVTNVDGEGRYDVGGLAAGEYEFYVSAREPMEVLFQSKVTIARDAELEHDVNLGGGRIVGSGRSAEGGVLESVIWILMRRTETGEDFSVRILGNRDGSFEVPSLVDGEYALYGIPQDGVHAFAVHSSVVVEHGASVGPIDVTFERGARARVLVRDPSGAPVVGAEVRLSDARGNARVLTEMQRTDTQGRMEITALPTGRVGLRARLGERESAEVFLDLSTGDAPLVELELE
ncbi:MAG: carboxypeptidase-like regulatory domain-containing protein [Planctomycetes bacterium]|nr:carboxypeptidase-like regulatory domain-containing protein [Planctomycetota bacterium]